MIQALGGCRIELRVSDENTPGSRAILKGCTGFLLLHNWGDHKITDPNELSKAVVITHSPYVLPLGPETAGTIFSCATRWVNKRGELGPLSEIYYTLVT